jgi:hypothetical protein
MSCYDRLGQVRLGKTGYDMLGQVRLIRLVQVRSYYARLGHVRIV